jgi:geranylgeranyl diphosphate synthase, type II
MNIDFYKNKVEEWINQYFEGKGSFNKKIYEAMSYSLNAGGKRIRPILMMLVYKMYKSNFMDILPMASAIEMIHTYSLIHDDLPCMDNDDLRRGMPTSHKVFGESLAVLAGDGLLNEAFDIMLKNSINTGVNTLNASYEIVSASGANGMIGGQVVDILSEGKNISEEELFYMHKKKTGALLRAAIVSGAILGNANKQEIGYLKDFGEKLGLAFQIKDDILDIEGNPEKLGKNLNSDYAKNKTTFITVYGLINCKEMCENLTKECINILKTINKNTEELQEITLFLLRRNF